MDSSAPAADFCPAPSESPKKKKHLFRFGCFLVFLSFFLVSGLLLMLFGIFVYCIAQYSPGEETEMRITESRMTGSGSHKVALIDIRGVILNGNSYGESANSEIICAMLDKAEKDPDVKGVILNLNTPGGEVTASDDIHHRIMELKKKKPVVALMNSIATSGGYYVAVACDRIVAGRMTLTGSIGVIISAYNYKGLFDKVGLQGETYKSGPMKDMLNPARLRTPEERVIVQKLVDESFDEFLRLVSAGRKIPLEQLRKSEVCDGRVIHGTTALRHKLVDRIGRLKEAMEETEKLLGCRAGSLRVVRYNQQVSFWETILSAESKTPRDIRLTLPGGPTSKASLPSGCLYYLPSFY